MRSRKFIVGVCSGCRTVKYTDRQASAMEKAKWKCTDEERAILEGVYRLNPAPDTPTKRKLAVQMRVAPRKIQTWFQNRRARERRLGGTVQRPPATPMASASDHAQGVFAHDPYMDAFARQLQHQPQLAAGVAQQLPIFPHVPLESSLTTHLRQAVVDSLKPAGGGLGGGEGGGAGVGAEGGCGARALSMAALQGVAPGAFPPGAFDSAALLATQVRPCTGTGNAIGLGLGMG